MYVEIKVCKMFTLRSTTFSVYYKQSTKELLDKVHHVRDSKEGYVHITSYPYLIIGWERVFKDLGASGVGSKVWVLTIGVLVVNHELDSIWDGLWRPGGAFFQIGLGCVMSHHQSPHGRALHIPVLILA